jgi:hypothetical protein
MYYKNNISARTSDSGKYEALEELNEEHHIQISKHCVLWRLITQQLYFNTSERSQKLVYIFLFLGICNLLKGARCLGKYCITFVGLVVS